MALPKSKIPGEPMLAALCARDDRDAARIIGVGITKLWELCNREESDPTRIRKTSYGKIPYSELQRHLAAELPNLAK